MQLGLDSYSNSYRQAAGRNSPARLLAAYSGSAEQYNTLADQLSRLLKATATATACCSVWLRLMAQSVRPMEAAS